MVFCSDSICTVVAPAIEAYSEVLIHLIQQSEEFWVFTQGRKI